jgi:hypothetical protein
MEKTKRYIMDKQWIGFFKAILETYEDIGVISVLDGRMGLIEIIYSAYFEEDLASLIEDVKQYGIVLQEVRGV